jgi:hypothetical protein
MITTKDVAAYMGFELRRRGGKLYHNDIAEWILIRFGIAGHQFVSQGKNHAPKIQDDVRVEFRAMNPDVEWKTRAGVVGVWQVRKPGSRKR